MRLLTVLSALPLLIGSIQAHALEVGENAPCVVLRQIAPGGAESEHCIRDPEKEGQAKILEFFSATCSDCAQNLPIVSHMAQDVRGHATTRLVGIDRSEMLLRNFVRDNASSLSFEVALDTNRDAKRAYDVIETPTLFVLDAQNKVLFKHTGVLSSSDVMKIEHIVGAR